MVFAVLSVEYGRLWTKPLDDEDDFELAIQVWRRRLAGLTQDEVELGLTKLSAGYPPKPTEFVELCRPVVVGAHKFFPKLLEAPRDRDLAQRAIERIKRMVRGERVVEVVGHEQQ